MKGEKNTKPTYIPFISHLMTERERRGHTGAPVLLKNLQVKKKEIAHFEIFLKGRC